MPDYKENCHKKKMVFFVGGISTSVGKTLVSALLVHAMKAAYFKPVQSGNLDNSDAKTIRSLLQSIGKTPVKIFPEAYSLSLPCSPDAAAQHEGIELDAQKIKLPQTKLPLVIEGSGGLLVPLNKKDTMLDILASWQIPIVLVSSFYLGSINHTLLSLKILAHYKIPIYGIVFNGKKNEHTVQAIDNHFLTKHKSIKKFFLPQLEKIGDQEIIKYASQLKSQWQLV